MHEFILNLLATAGVLILAATAAWFVEWVTFTDILKSLALLTVSGLISATVWIIMVARRVQDLIGKPIAAQSSALAEVATQLAGTHTQLSGALDEATNRLTNAGVELRSMLNKLPIITNNDMGVLETSIEAHEIWLCSPDLHRELTQVTASDGQRHFQVNPYVRSNTDGQNAHGRTVTYHIFAPKHRRTAPSQTYPNKAYAETYDLAVPGRVKFHFLQDEVWQTMPYKQWDLIIFNPETTTPRAYVELPYGEDRGYWLELQSYVVDNWVQDIKRAVKTI